MLAELSIEVHELLKVVNEVLLPRYDIKGITTRGGKSTNVKKPTKTDNDSDQNVTIDPQTEKRAILEEIVKNKDPPIISEKTNQPLIKPPPQVPFPNRFRKEKEDALQKKFMENLKQLHINMPIIEALAQMPKYAKYLKSLLTKKTLEEAYTVAMNERCSALLLNKLPSKAKDPGSFTIPCKISNIKIDNTLADLGASISLMPYAIYEKLGLGEPKPTRIKITLRVGDDEVVFYMDQSIKRPPSKDAECYGIDDLDETINLKTHELLEDDQLDAFPLKSLEIKDYNLANISEFNSIRRIDLINTAYSIKQKTNGELKTKLEHLRLVTLKEKGNKPELMELSTHLEYEFLNNDEYFPVIVSSQLFEKEKCSLL
ncbi:reverse transcriptase domain-containing protein [Tanacetum coccineum]